MAVLPFCLHGLVTVKASSVVQSPFLHTYYTLIDFGAFLELHLLGQCCSDNSYPFMRSDMPLKRHALLWESQRL